MKQDFSYKDLVLNEDFRAWVIHKTNSQYWDEWLKANTAYQPEIDKAIKIVIHLQFETYNMPAGDLSELWDRITGSKAKIVKLNRNTFSLVLKIAASLLIIGAVGIGLYMNTSEEPMHDTISFVSKENPKGQKSTFSLPDGSKVTLNSGSVLKYPSKFAKGKREVELTGEAFFEVKRDESHPFVVSSGNVQTKVLGTTFNVAAYPDKDNVAVMLATGKVKVSGSSGALLGHSYLLNPGEQFVYKKKNKSIEVSTYDSEEAFGWKEGILLFTNSSLGAISWRLEMWYDVNVELRVDSPEKYHFTGKFKNQSLEHVLKGLSFTLGFKYSINDNKVIISN